MLGSKALKPWHYNNSCMSFHQQDKKLPINRTEVPRVHATTASFVQVQTGTLVACGPLFIIIANDKMPQGQIHPRKLGGKKCKNLMVLDLFCNLDRSWMFLQGHWWKRGLGFRVIYIYLFISFLFLFLFFSLHTPALADHHISTNWSGTYVNLSVCSVSSHEQSHFIWQE